MISMINVVICTASELPLCVVSCNCFPLYVYTFMLIKSSLMTTYQVKSCFFFCLLKSYLVVFFIITMSPRGGGHIVFPIKVCESICMSVCPSQNVSTL